MGPGMGAAEPTGRGTVGPQLSSVATALAELTTRLSQIAEALASTSSDDLANELFEVERSLLAATRRLDKLVDDLSTP